MSARLLVDWAAGAMPGPAYAEIVRLLTTFKRLSIGPATFLVDLAAADAALSPSLLPIAEMSDGRVAVLHFHPDLLARACVPVALCGDGRWIDQADSLRMFVAQMLALRLRDATPGQETHESLCRRFRWATGGGRPWPPPAWREEWAGSAVEDRIIFRELVIQGADHQLADWAEAVAAEAERAPFLGRDLERSHTVHFSGSLARATLEGAPTQGMEAAWADILDCPAYTAGSVASARLVRRAAEAAGAASRRTGLRGDLLNELDQGFLGDDFGPVLARAVEAAEALEPGGPLTACLRRGH